jgi:NAD(P)-dependent dehydrogenase (short-subunit alcohol dehydrogenase family)
MRSRLGWSRSHNRRVRPPRVNNAGGTRRGSFFQQTARDWREGFELKFFAHVQPCRMSWPLLKETQGAVVLPAPLVHR